MSSSPSVLTENQESPPAPKEQAASSAENKAKESGSEKVGNDSTSPSNTANTSSNSNPSETKVPPPLLQNQKSNSGHRRRMNSNQQQPPLFSAQPMFDPVMAGFCNPGFFPNMFSYSADYNDLWSNPGAGAFVDPALWNGTLQSPNDIVFAYSPQFPNFGFSPDGLPAQPIGAPSFTFDVQAGGLQPGQQQGGQTSPMMSGVFSDTLNQRLREITLSGSSETGPIDDKQEAGQNNANAKKSDGQDDSSSRTWANVASAQSQQSQQPASSNTWNSTGRNSQANMRTADMLEIGRSSTEPGEPMFDRVSQMPRTGHVAGIIPFNPVAGHRAEDPLPRRNNYGAFDQKSIYNAQDSLHSQSQTAVELCRKNDYNPKEFKLDTNNAKYFIIKSFAEDDVFASVKNSVWCSTVRGNDRLHKAFTSNQGPIYMFYSVNNTGNFCGVAQMITAVDPHKDAGCWSQPRWKGLFSVKWIYIKDIPFREFKEITLDNNEGKPVFKSRDTQEILPPELGIRMLNIFHNYRSQTTLFDDFSYYEERALAGANQQQPLHLPGGCPSSLGTKN